MDAVDAVDAEQMQGSASAGELAARLLDPEFYADNPFPVYARLRAEAPVARIEANGCWVVSRHADVLAVSKDSETFCSSKGIMMYEIGSEFATPPTMMHADPPEHTRYRAMVQPGFRPAFMRALAPGIRSRTLALVDRLSSGVPVDVVAELTVPLPLQVICDLLGVPEDEWQTFHRWSEAVIPGATDWPEAERMKLGGEMIAYLLAAAADRRASPKDDFISELAAVQSENGDRLSDTELAMFLVQLLVAGNETTRNMMSGGLLGFADHPGEWEALRRRHLANEPRAVANAVEEMLRWTTPVVSFMRTATRDAVIGDQLVTKGDPILMLYASANRDEAVFGDTGERFMAGRTPNPHLAFGFGAHFCIGAALARLEGQILLEELMARFGAVSSVGSVVRTASPVIAGIRSASLVFAGA